MNVTHIRSVVGRDRRAPEIANTRTARRSVPIQMKNIVYFDLETQKSAAEVGGWDKKRDMKMSVGVTYSTGDGQYRIFPRNKPPI